MASRILHAPQTDARPKNTGRTGDQSENRKILLPVRGSILMNGVILLSVFTLELTLPKEGKSKKEPEID